MSLDIAHTFTWPNTGSSYVGVIVFPKRKSLFMTFVGVVCSKYVVYKHQLRDRSYFTYFFDVL